MLIELPDPSLVLLVGPSGTGKTSFASRHFKATEILSSDAFRAMVADDEGSREADSDAFQALRFVAAKRLRRGRLTVIDATNVRPRSRRPFIALAAARGLAVAALVFDLPEGGAEIAQPQPSPDPGRGPGGAGGLDARLDEQPGW